MKAKAYSDLEFMKLLSQNGYVHCRTRGDHAVYTNGERHLTINRKINKFVARRLIKEYSLCV